MMTHAPTPVGGRPALRRALRDEVFDVLLEKIAGGQVEPDAPLGIDPLAAELGVSPAVLNEYLRADWAFHQAILEAASNRFLSQMAQHMSTHGQRLRQFLDTQHTDADLAVAEHAEILAAFETGEADAAVEAMSRHIDAVHARAVEDFGNGRSA